MSQFDSVGRSPRPVRVRPERWEISNFKSIEHAMLDLGELSILTGANSAGKSSLMQSLLLLAQSTAEGQLALNGPVVMLGEGADVVRAGQRVVSLKATFSTLKVLTDERVRLSLSVDLVNLAGDLSVQGIVLREGETVILEASRGGRMVRSFQEGQRPIGVSSSASLEPATVLQVGFVAGVPRHSPMLIEMRGLVPEGVYVRRTQHQRERDARDLLEMAKTDRTRTHDREFLFRRALASAELSPALQSLRGSLGPRLRPSMTLAKLIADLSPDDESALASLLSAALGEWEGEVLGRRVIARTPRLVFARTRSEALAEALYYLGASTEGMGELASSIRYLGPLRDEPRVVYPMGRGSRHLPVGSHGEFTSDLLARLRARPLTYVSPDGRELTEPLEEAVSRWVNYLGIGTRISVSDRGKLGRTIRLEIEGVERDLTTVGVGASQLLPVVVALLAADSGSLFLFEQPELHLHPAVQSRLGDFLSTARPDVRLVVETHSESLINRLRLRVVEERLRADRIQILFGEQVEGVTQFRRLEMNDFGDLDEWPAGFFDEGPQDAARLVALLTKRMTRDGQGRS